MALAHLDQIVQALFDEGVTATALQAAAAKLDDFGAAARIRAFRLVQHAIEDYERTGNSQALDAALHALGAASGAFAPGSWEAQLAQYGAYFQNLQAHLRSAEEQLESNKALEAVESQLTEFGQQLAWRQYTEAAWSLVSLRKTLQDAADAAATDAGDAAGSAAPPAGLAALREASASCERQLLQAVTGLLSQGLAIHPAERYVELRSSLPDGSSVADLWQALEVSGLLAGHMSATAHALLQDVAAPILAAGCSLHVTPAAEPGQPALLSWPGPVSDGSATPLDHALQQLLQLVGQALFQYNGSLMKAFGDLAWRPLADLYVQMHVRPYMAAVAEDADACEAKLGAAQDLEAYAESLGYVEDEKYLSSAVEALVREALLARQQGYLDAARSALLASPGDQAAGSTVTVGQPLAVDGELWARSAGGQLQEWEAADPPCGVCLERASVCCSAGQWQVTRRAVALQELMQQALQDACRASSRAVAKALCQAAASVALLARTVTPRAANSSGRAPPGPSESPIGGGGYNPASPAQSATPPPQSVLDVPLLALLQHNDLLYLAQQLLLQPQALASELQGALGADSAAAALKAFQEDALQLRRAAEQIRGAFLRSQRSLYEELLDGLGSLQRLSGPAHNGIACRRVVRQVLHSLGRLGRLTLELLPPRAFLDIACSVLNTICDRLLVDISLMHDIGIDDSRELVSVCSPLVEEAVPALLTLPDSAALAQSQAAVSGVPLQQLAAALEDGVPKLCKLRRLLLILEAKMADILSAWQSGALQADGFSLPEVEQLVRALFEETQYRQEVLHKLLCSGSQDGSSGGDGDGGSSDPSLLSPGQPSPALRSLMDRLAR